MRRGNAHEHRIEGPTKAMRPLTISFLLRPRSVLLCRQKPLAGEDKLICLRRGKGRGLALVRHWQWHQHALRRGNRQYIRSARADDTTMWSRTSTLCSVSPAHAQYRFDCLTCT